MALISGFVPQYFPDVQNHGNSWTEVTTLTSPCWEKKEENKGGVEGVGKLGMEEGETDMEKKNRKVV